MATKKVSNVTPLPMSPSAHDLPDDGTPVTFSQTFARKVGTKIEDDRVPTAEDFEDSEWEVRRQTPDGWEFVEKIEGMPLDNELREDYGSGKYELTPVDPRTGKLIKQLRKVRLISATISPTGNGAYSDMQYAPPLQFGATDDMPPWVRWQMQQAAEEKQEQRRRADEALQRQRDFEEKLALREFERQEREERERQRKEEREAEEARRRDERFATLITAGVGLAQAVLGKQHAPPQGRDVNEVLLRELMEDRRQRTPQVNGMRDSLELLVVLDKLAQTRATAMGRRDDDDEDDGGGDDNSLGTMIASMLPAMLQRGGGAAQLSSEAADQLVEQALANPDTISKIASKNPQATADVFLRAIRANPALERAVLTAVERAAAPTE